MKSLKKYLLSMVVMLFFTCSFMGVKAEAAAPKQVTGLEQTETSSSGITIEWNAMLENGVDYEVYISTDKAKWILKADTTYSSNYKTIYGLNAGTTYYVRVRAYIQEKYNSPKVYGAYSSVLECVTAPNSVPSYVRKVRSTTTEMKVEWKRVPGANAYVVAYVPSSASSSTAVKTTIATKTSVILKKLKKNSNYDVVVYAARRTSNKEQIAMASSGKRVNYLGVTPGKVSGVECAYYWKYSKELSVNCKKIESADGYHVEVWTAYGKPKKIIGKISSSPNAIYLKHGAFGKRYMFKIRARAYTENYKGTKSYGTWSSWKYTCQQPEVTSIQSTSKGLKVSWDTIKGADKYVLYASTKQKSGYKKVISTTKSSYTMTKFNKKALKKGQKYYFYVVAYNKDGRKYYSGEAGNANMCWYNTYRR